MIACVSELCYAGSGISSSVQERLMSGLWCLLLLIMALFKIR